MTANKYYPKQMNGAIINTFGTARDNEYSNAELIQKYLYQLSIENSNETELENIGRLIGYLRPLVPEGFNQENIFLIGDLPLTQDILVGFANETGAVGGELTSSESSLTGYLTLSSYRRLLKYMGIVKRYGITINAIDKIGSIFGDNYTISWLENGDISLNYLNNIGYKNLWILSKLFYRTATVPQVIITSETGE